MIQLSSKYEDHLDANNPLRIYKSYLINEFLSILLDIRDSLLVHSEVHLKGLVLLLQTLWSQEQQ